MLGRLIYTLNILLFSCYSQITYIKTNQPYPLLSYQTIYSCCNLTSSSLNYSSNSSSSSSRSTSENLMSCISNLNIKVINSKVGIVTYITNSIIDYASYAIAINIIYSEHNNYEFKIQTSENGNNYEPTDARWNKVKILENAIDENNGWAKDYSYVVWLDADLAILDMGMKIELIGETYPDSDIIMSADLDYSSSLANSGYILVRNTKWSKYFLSLWWSYDDRSRMSDQSALILLYQTLSKEDQNHIKILPIDSLNTHFPPYIHQKDYNQVLHLAGETNAFRKRMFQKGFNEICSSFSLSSSSSSLPSSSSSSSSSSLPLDSLNEILKQIRPIPHQLSLTKEYLAESFQQMTSVRIMELKQLQSKYTSDNITINSTNFTDIIGYFKYINNIANSALDLQKGSWEEFHNPTNAHNSNNIIKSQFYYLEIEILKWCYISYKNITKLYSKTIPYWRDFEDQPNQLLNYQLKQTNLQLAEYNREIMSLAYNIIDFHSGYYTICLSNNNNNNNDNKITPEVNKQIDLMLTILYELKNEVMPEFQKRLLPEYYTRGKYYEFKLYQFITGILQQREANSHVLETLLSYKQAIIIWRELHQHKFYGTSYITVDPLKEGSRTIKHFGEILCFELKDVKFNMNDKLKKEFEIIKEITSLTVDGIFLEGIKYLNEAKELMEESLESFKGNILANNGVIIDEILVLARVHGELGSCYSQLEPLSYKYKSIENFQISLNYLKRLYDVEENYQLSHEYKLFKSQVEYWIGVLSQQYPKSSKSSTLSSTITTNIVDPIQSDDTPSFSHVSDSQSKNNQNQNEVHDNKPDKTEKESKPNRYYRRKKKSN